MIQESNEDVKLYKAMDTSVATEKTSTKDYKLSMALHLNGDDGGELQHRNDDLGLTRVVWTPKVGGQWGKGVATWFLDGDDTEYKTLPDCVNAMRESELFKDERSRFVALFDAESEDRP